MRGHPALGTRFRWACLGLLLLGARLPGEALAQRQGPAALGEPDAEWVQATLRTLSLRDKIGQLVHVRTGGLFLNRRSPEFLEVADAVVRNRVGGVVLFAGQVYESALLLNELQQASRLPLLVAADFERGAAFRVTGSTSFPWAMAVGAAGSEDLARRQGQVTAEEARALGVHWVYAPVLDVNNNPENPVINVRAYGEDPALVARLGAAFIRGCRERGALATAKHFPGHGDTATDSHVGLPRIPATRERLEALELVPFRSAIAAGVDAIMTAHVAVAGLTGEAELPATLSSRVLTDLLRGDLGFEGLVATDALEMGGIRKRYWAGEAAVRALQAGADVLILSPNPDAAVGEVERAVRRGDLAEARIDRSVERLLVAKTRVGLHRVRTVPVERIASEVSSPEHLALAEEIAARSVTLVKDERGILPVDPRSPPRVFSVTLAADLDPAPAPVFQAELRRRFPGTETASVDSRTPEALVARILRSAADADLVVVASVVRVVTGRGSVGLPDGVAALLGRLLAGSKPVLWVALGNPYLLRHFPRAPSYLATFSTSEPSQAAAARAIAGEIAVTGRLPVSIPGQARAGGGLERPKLDMRLSAMAPGAPARETFRRTERLLTESVARRTLSGAALAVGHRGSLVFETAAGTVDARKGAAPAGPDTPYPLGSLSGSVGAVTAGLMLVESGDLLPDAAAADYVPEFRGPGKERVRVRHLFEQTSGLPAFAPPRAAAAHASPALDRPWDAPLESAPGDMVRYSDPALALLGEVAERAGGRPIETFLEAALFRPLGMSATAYRPRARDEAPAAARGDAGALAAEGAGAARAPEIVSTARDLSRFAQLLVWGGIYDHRRYLRRATVDRLARPEGASVRPWGWSKPRAADWTGATFSRSAYGYAGPGGTMLWIDPERQAFVVLVVGRARPGGGAEEAASSIVRSAVAALDGAAR